MLYALCSARVISVAVLAALMFTSSAHAQVIEQVRIAAVNLSYVAQSSKAGKSALAQIEEAGKKKEAEAAMRAAELEQQRFELQQRGSVMSERARADLQKAFEKGRVDFRRFQEDAKSELAGLQR